MYSSDEPFQRSAEGYFGVYFPKCEATRETNTKITLEWAQKRFVLHDITNLWTTIKTTSCTHRPLVSFARFSFCWWCHNRLLMTSQWPDHCDAITWIMISNSLDIDLFMAIFTFGRVRKSGDVRNGWVMTSNRKQRITYPCTSPG